MMKDFGFDLDRALDRVGDKATLFGFQDPRHAREIVGDQKAKDSVVFPGCDEATE